MADEAQSFNEGWDRVVIYLSVTQAPFIIAILPLPLPLRDGGVAGVEPREERTQGGMLRDHLFRC